MEEKWITPSELLDALDGSLLSKQTTIISWLRTKLLGAKADVIIINGEKSGTDIPHELWNSEKDRSSDWEQGYFANGIYHGYLGHSRYEAFGVKFKKADAEQRGANFDRVGGNGGSPGKPFENRGGRKRSTVWPNFVAELCWLIKNKGVPDGVGTEGAEAMINAVLGALSERGLGTIERSTVQPAINATLRRLRADN